MRFATWNVNSARARIDRITAFLERQDIDVLAMQETKCKDAQFPAERFTELGYQVAHFGLSQWNGVAVVSRVGLEDVAPQFPGQPGFHKDPEQDQAVEARALGATCDGVRVWSLYVPNGRELDDPHYTYKLDWLAKLRDQAAGWLEQDGSAQVMLAGDWNVAPTDDDVWDPAFFEGKTHTSQPERDAFDAFADAGYVEVTRAHTPDQYTYWDYTQLRFPKKEGMRIDFAVCSPALAARVTGASIDREERKGKGASDHAPVIVELG
ncbi:exodeoxyribonuclease III [Tomitella gaofuii]|uniref:exodeoxyribonuclease III n=1 Tax=Tomitella gaofuii TaxID=2760083 RepID=UPI0015F838FD|nr:exodeoxyribonuclease III [Tomitella gaofuii]